MASQDSMNHPNNGYPNGHPVTACRIPLMILFTNYGLTEQTLLLVLQETKVGRELMVKSSIWIHQELGLLGMEDPTEFQMDIRLEWRCVTGFSTFQ